MKTDLGQSDRAVAINPEAADADRAELLAQIERLTIRGEAHENAYRIAYQATYQSHTGHWDKTGGSGSGCPECIRAREARENCDAAIQDGLKKMADRAETQRSSHADGSNEKETVGAQVGAAPPLTRDQILGAVARGWCAPLNSHKVMDSDLAFAIADELFAAMQHPSGGDQRTEGSGLSDRE